jgi:CHASE2 domain-containing sensor protein
VGKLVVLKLGEGRFDQGFPVTLQIGEEGDRPFVEVNGKLPPAPELLQNYSRWQYSYHRLGLRSRLEAPAAQVTNVAFVGDCRDAAQELRNRLNTWLQAETFRPIREKWLEQLSPNDEIRVILQGADLPLQRLPWHLWDLLERYTKAELALSAPIYQRISPPPVPRGKIRILAILGNSAGIDVQADRALLEQLPDADVSFLVEPDRQDLTDRLWERRWDILFFAGHSASQPNGETGQIYINPTDSLSIGELRYALKKAMERGLKLAIFNSCDGLGLARELADLQIPQMIVMREPVPDRVAQRFLQYFLATFSRGKSLYLAVREARERLQGLEDQFPCATWLPVICQNPAEVPFTWQALTGQLPPPDTLIRSTIVPRPATKKRTLPQVIAISLAIAASLVGLRYLGYLQPIELAAFDRMLQLRPDEGPDPRLLLITISDDDIQTQERGRGSLSEPSLERVLEKLEPYHPRAIGLDIYRDFPVDPSHSTLAKRLQQTDSLIAVCKSSDPSTNVTGIAPPPEVPGDRVGFSDFVEDSDGTIRRQLLFISPDPTSRCATPYSLSSQLAFRYLVAEGMMPGFTESGDLRMGNTTFKSLLPRTGAYQPLSAGGSQIMLNYRATPRIAAQVSLTQVLNGQVNLAAAKDKIVLIGVTAQSTGDYWPTPFGAGPFDRMAGVSVQAHMVSQILSAVLDRRPLLWVWNPWLDAIWIGSWTLAGGLITWQIRTHRRLAKFSSLSLMVAIATTCVLLYGICFGVLIRGGWLPVVPSGLGLLIASGSIAAFTPVQTRHDAKSGTFPA